MEKIYLFDKGNALVYLSCAYIACRYGNIIMRHKKREVNINKRH